MPPRKRTKGQTKIAGADQPYERLSSGTENYLLSLYKMWEDEPEVPPTITQLTDTLRKLPSAEGLGTSVPSVTGMVRRMQRQALVEVGQDKCIRLTKKGVEGAEDIARRHRLAEWLVVRLLGMELYQAHTQAHRLEHGMSPELEEKLAERLNHPTRSPFGRPIPGSGEPRVPANSLTLDEATPEVPYLVARVPEEDTKLLHFLVDSLIVPDHEIKVVEAAPYLGVLQVATQRDTMSIGYNVAHQILVRTSAED